MDAMTVGVEQFHLALLTKDDATGVTYEASEYIDKIASADVKPTVNSATWYGDNAAAETDTSVGETTLTIELRGLTLEQQAKYLGHTLAADGTMLCKASDVAPYLAAGLVSNKSNGKKRYLWLLKGKAQEPDESAKTKSDKPELQALKLEFKFVSRDHDGARVKKTDEDATGYTATIGTNWFDVTKTLNIPTTP